MKNFFKKTTILFFFYKIIKNKNYKLRFQGKLAEKKVTVKKILGIGISYDRKTKKHSCQVEWL